MKTNDDVITAMKNTLNAAMCRAGGMSMSEGYEIIARGILDELRPSTEPVSEKYPFQAPYEHQIAVLQKLLAEASEKFAAMKARCNRAEYALAGIQKMLDGAQEKPGDTQRPSPSGYRACASYAGSGGVCVACGVSAEKHFGAPTPEERGCTPTLRYAHPHRPAYCGFCALPLSMHTAVERSRAGKHSLFVYGTAPRDFVVGELDGKRVLAIPFVALDDYFARPRWWRWTYYLAASIFGGPRPVCVKG